MYLQRTLTILRNEGVNPVVALEFSPRRAGIFCGIAEVRGLLARVLPESGSEVWALSEGDSIEAGEVALRVKAPYSSVGLYETAISGILAQSTGFASAARECVDAAKGTPVLAPGRAARTPGCRWDSRVQRHRRRVRLMLDDSRRSTGGYHTGGEHAAFAVPIVGRDGTGDGGTGQAHAARGAAGGPRRHVS